MDKKRILVVEDNIYVRRLFEISLTAQYQVIQAGSRAEALTKLHEELVHLAFVDIGLDEYQGGMLLLEAMHADENLKHIPVVIVSARSQPEDVEMARQRGAKAYLAKPFSVDQLMELARTLSL